VCFAHFVWFILFIKHNSIALLFAFSLLYIVIYNTFIVAVLLDFDGKTAYHTDIFKKIMPFFKKSTPLILF